MNNMIRLIQLLAECIREAGEIPSGPLYALLMTKNVTFSQYNDALDVLKGASVISEDGNHLLKWIGPKLEIGD